MPSRIEKLEFAQAESADALISPEGDLLVVEFNIGAEEPLRFGLPFAAAKELFAKMIYLTSATIDDKTVRGGMDIVRMTQVATVQVSPNNTSKAISMCLTDVENIPHHFALSTQTSAQLRPKLRSAEAIAERGGKTRNL